MIHEFAVEPEVMAKLEHFNVLWPYFGVEHGRFLAEFPGDWRKRVLTLADQLPTVRAHAIKSKLQDLSLRRQKLVGAGGRPSGTSDWQANAVQQQRGARPFRAIVVGATNHHRDDVLVVGEFDREAEPWKVRRQDEACPRNADEMFKRAWPLLEHSDKLKLVDRNFDPSLKRFRRPFKAFVRARSQWGLLELHSALPPHCNHEAVVASYRSGLERALPTGSTLTVFLWPGIPDQDRMHPRFVLTERGGLHFDYGLDDSDDRAETTLVTLLEHEVFLRQWQDFGEHGTCFGKPTRFMVEGRG